MSDHTVTMEFGKYGPEYTMTCNAPFDAYCHAVYECDCESWNSSMVTGNGQPFHVTYDFREEGHYGYFDSDECNLVTWFENSEETLRGILSFDVKSEFMGDYYIFHVEEK